ncbi:MAG: MFS transporter [Rhodospirillaceae bacterium]|nr:MFS transporter [Rhodospirillaceae bacterium]
MAYLTSLVAVFLSALILNLGNGLLGVILPVRGSLEQFPTVYLGLLGTFYAGGFVVGCLVCPYLIRRVGHIRAFAVLAALGANCALLFAILMHPLPWLLLRFCFGVALAGLLMVTESWLNEQSTNATRGRVFSAYMLVNSGSVLTGQLMVALGEPSGFALFALACSLVCTALIPVGLTTTTAPRPPSRVTLRLGRLYRRSPVAIVGAFLVGVVNGSFNTLGVVFVLSIGFSPVLAAIFISAAMLGGSLAQWPAGAASDRMDRRWVVITFATAGTCMALTMWASDGGWVSDAAAALGLGVEPLWIGLAVGFGLSAYPLYGVLVAHMNDHVDRDGFVEASGGMLLLWGLGASTGPLLASAAMAVTTPHTLFLVMALGHASLIGFTLFRMARRPAPAMEGREVFQPAAIGRTTPAAASLDPRAPD